MAASGAVQPHVALDVNVEEDGNDDEAADRLWATIEQVASPQRRNLAIVALDPGSASQKKKEKEEVVDVRRLDRRGAQRVLQRALATADCDNAKLLRGIRDRLDACVMQQISCLLLLRSSIFLFFFTLILSPMLNPIDRLLLVSMICLLLLFACVFTEYIYGVDPNNYCMLIWS